MAIETNLLTQIKVNKQYTPPQLTQTVTATQPLPPEKPDVFVKENKKSHKTEYITAGIFTGAGLLMFLNRNRLAKLLVTPPEKPIINMPEGLVDDTLKQAAEVVKQRFENVITSQLYNEIPLSELTEYLRFAEGKTKHKILGIISDIHNFTKDCDDETYIKTTEKYIKKIVEDKEDLDYQGPSFIEGLAKAYIKTGRKEEGFNLMDTAIQNYEKGWCQDCFIRSKIELLSEDGQHKEALKIWDSAKSVREDASNYRDLLFAVMKSRSVENGAARACDFFENCRFGNHSKAVNLYVQLATENGMSNRVIKYATSSSYNWPADTITFLKPHLDKLPLSEESRRIFSALEELTTIEHNYEWKSTPAEVVKEAIECLKRIKEKNFVPPKHIEEYIEAGEKYLENPTVELNKQFTEHACKYKKEDPLYIKLKESFNLE